MNLAGLWHYSTEDNSDFSLPGYDVTGWKTMSIPSNWFLSGLDHHGVVWFRREFLHRSIGDYFDLHFEGVDYFSDVYLNGFYLGHHTGYFDPFTFDVTNMLRSGKNMLAIRVESPYEMPGPDGWHLRKQLIKGVLNHHDCRPGGGWEPEGQSFNTGGIWNRVSIKRHGAVTIDRFLLRTDLDAQPPILIAELMIHNRVRKDNAQLVVTCIPKNFKGNPQSATFNVELPEGISIHKVQMPVKDIRLWQPWDRGFPYLYNISASLVCSNSSAIISSDFGFRTIRVESGFRWFINDQSYFPRGSNYLPSQWLSETLFPEIASSKEHPFGGCAGGKFYSRDVDLARHANLNLLRVHAHVLPPEFHQTCDLSGMLIWQDFPLQWGYSDAPEFHAEAERQMRAMVIGLVNHPSIIAWCCHNESPCDSPWMAGRAGEIFDPAHNSNLDANLEAVVREIDSSRYIHKNSGTGDGHVYPGWYVGHWRDFKDTPGAPFVTEYGAQGLPVKLDIQRMVPQFGSEAGHEELVRFKTWLESQNKVSGLNKGLISIGTLFWNLAEKNRWRKLQNWIKGWGININRSAYKQIPTRENTPVDLQHARDVWETWRFHDFQPPETFDNGIHLGDSIDDFIASSQTYQAFLLQYATESYRRKKYSVITGIIQFDFCDPWPSVTWSVVDYWRMPKPAYETLKLSMQPVLPCCQFPERLKPGKETLLSFCVVNDFLQPFPAATCNWRLESSVGEIATDSFKLDIPADGISAGIKLRIPSLGSGIFKLFVSVQTNRKSLGFNMYDLIIK